MIHVIAVITAKPGMREYELQAEAEYVFKKNGAFGAAYFALIATGRPMTRGSRWRKRVVWLS